jgi:hypothetical protein
MHAWREHDSLDLGADIVRCPGEHAHRMLWGAECAVPKVLDDLHLIDDACPASTPVFGERPLYGAGWRRRCPQSDARPMVFEVEARRPSTVGAAAVPGDVFLVATR